MFENKKALSYLTDQLNGKLDVLNKKNSLNSKLKS